MLSPGQQRGIPRPSQIDGLLQRQRRCLGPDRDAARGEHEQHSKTSDSTTGHSPTFEAAPEKLKIRKEFEREESV
jgi:hypothetical protein